LQNVDLGEVEQYFPELPNYGVWWVKRYLLETEGGEVVSHAILSGPASDVPNLAKRLVAKIDTAVIEPKRKGIADRARQ
jgi:hypothetical protein